MAFAASLTDPPPSGHAFGLALPARHRAFALMAARGFATPTLVRAGALASMLAASLAGCSNEDPHRGALPPIDPPPPAPLVCAPVEPGDAPARLLTRVQYDNTIHDLFGDETKPARLTFPPENQVLGFETNAELHKANPLLVDNYLNAAEGVATRAASSGALARYLPCELDGRTTDGCVETFVDRLGSRAFRRPLSNEERAVFVVLQTGARAKYGFATSIQLVVEAMLQSPQFLYRVDTYSAPTEASGAVAIGGYEMASRLSYFLWNSMPDDALFDAARADELASEADVEAQARRMIADPRARGVVQDFHRQWLMLDRFGGIVREAPGIDGAELMPSLLRASLEAFIDHVYWEDGKTVAALFSSPTVFVNGTLARALGMGGVFGDALVSVEADPKERVGLLTQPGLMALESHPTQSSPIKRGVFVRERIMCHELPSPPPTVDQTPPDPDPSLTTRERFRDHTAAPTCAECHNKIDGLGFGFENYDQLGQYRFDENGLVIDSSGYIAEPEDQTIEGAYDGAPELMAKLGSSAQVKGCVATMWYRYAMGRIETDDDLCSLKQLNDRVDASGGHLHELLVALTLTDAFRFRPPMEHDTP